MEQEWKSEKLVKSFAPRCQWIHKSPSTEYRCDKVALRTTCIKNVKFKFKIVKITIGC